MSRVYFHSKTHETDVLGSERGHASCLVTDLAMTVLGVDPSGYGIEYAGEVLRGVVVGPSYAPMPPPGSKDYAAWREWAQKFSTAFRTSYSNRDPIIAWKGSALSPWRLQLNTALALGSDAVKFAARLHGQCEVHAWVDEANRPWLADIVQAGIDAGILRAQREVETLDRRVIRQDTGWRVTINHLRCTGTWPGPVVMSYSVCDSFPSRGLLTPPPDADENGNWFYDLGHGERWDRCMAALRAQGNATWLELTPARWADYHFGEGVTVMDLVAVDRDDRLARKLDALTTRDTSTGGAGKGAEL